MNSPSDPLSNSDEWVIWGVVWLRYVTMMSLTILIHDTLLTLDDEVCLVWPGPLALPKALYYINRYLTIVITICSSYGNAGFHPPFSIQLSVSLRALISMFCQIFVSVIGIANLVRITAATGMLCLRVAALYKNVRWVIWSLWAGFVVCHGIRMILSILAIIILAADMKYSLIGGMCLPGGTWQSKFSPSAYISISFATILDLSLLVLTIVRTLRSTAISKSHPSSPIMRALLRHELLYFVIITIIRTATTVVVIVFPPSWISFASVVERALESMLISRFFLNLRSIFYYGQPTANSQTAVSPPTRIRTHRFWRRPRQLTARFSVGPGAETSISGGLATQNERGIPQAESVDLDFGMELRTRRDEDEDDIQLGCHSESRTSIEPIGAPTSA